MFQRLEQLNDRYIELTESIAQPEVIADFSLYQEYLRERASLEETIKTWHRYQVVVSQLEDAQKMSSDPEMADIAAEETRILSDEQNELLAQLKLLLVPPDPMDERNVFLELRAGAGGDEAALFASDLLRMYLKFAETHRLQTKILSLSDTTNN